jgi:hypothetical protein
MPRSDDADDGATGISNQPAFFTRPHLIEVYRWQRSRLGRSLALPAQLTLHMDEIRSGGPEFRFTC